MTFKIAIWLLQLIKINYKKNCLFKIKVKFETPRNIKVKILMIILANFASVKLWKSFNEDFRINLPVRRKRGKEGQILCKNISQNKVNLSIGAENCQELNETNRKSAI